jgi:integrase
MARINIFNITTTPDRPKPYRLKWTIDSRHKSRSFKTKGEAEKFKHRLEQALEDGSNFDPISGLPDQWVAQLRGFADVASEYSATKWHEWSASSRSSFCDGASVVVYELIRPKAKGNYDRFEILRVIRNHILNQNASKISTKDAEIKSFVIENTYRLKEITPELVTKTISLISHRTDGVIASYDTQRKRKQTFGAIMDYAFRHNYIKDNSFKRVRVKPLATLKAIDPGKALNPSECRTYCQLLRNHAKIKKGYYMEAADFLELIWLAGLRPSEVAGLQAKHIHLFSDHRTSYIKVEQAVVSVNRGYADDLSSQEHKGLKARSKNSFRTVPILSELIPTLTRLVEGKDKNDYLFTAPREKSKPVKTDMINDYFRRVCFSNHTPYDLRHTNASILIYSGLNIIEVANRLGNSIEVCQKVYLHMINRIEEISTVRENTYLESTKHPLDNFLIEQQLAVIYPERD